MGQDERGIWTAPSGAKIAWFLDPDGNNLSLTQFDVLDTTGPAAAVPTTSVGHQHCRQPRPAAIRREEQSSRDAPREG
jgi:hypothetical protein